MSAIAYHVLVVTIGKHLSPLLPVLYLIRHKCAREARYDYTALATTDRVLTTTDVMTAFGAFLRLYVADGDASPATIRSYYGNAVQFVAWCGEHGINPASVTGDDIALIHPRGQAGDHYLELSETPEKDLTKLISYGIINEK
jgi:hypothetical protein